MLESAMPDSTIVPPTAENVTPEALRLIMQRKDYQTTQRSIDVARRTVHMTSKLFVPEVGQRKAN
jgi:hypothetical protein